MTSKTDPPQEPSDELELDFSIADLSDAADMADMEPPRPKPKAKASDDAVNRFIQTDRHGRDRRRWKRFTIEGAIVMIPQTAFWRMGKTSYIKLGPVKNIGMKGLAIHYVEKTRSCWARPPPSPSCFRVKALLWTKSLSVSWAT